MEQLMRNSFLFLSKNKALTKLAKKYGLRFGAGRFVAGETIELATAAIKQLNKQGLCVTIDYLGNSLIMKRKQMKWLTNRLKQSVQLEEGLDSQLSLKMTSMGLDISDEIVMNNMRRILEAAKENGVFVTIDMEDYTRCGKTIDIFKQLKSEYDNIGTVIQAYLYRTEKDIEDLNAYNPNLRLVKGAYKEPEEVAFPDKKDVDDNYKKIIKMHLLNGNYTAIASHDRSDY